MKKGYIFLILICISIIYMSLTVNSAIVINNKDEYITAYKNNNLLRLHVLANSNTPRDQFIKRKIRDKVVKNLNINKKDFKKDELVMTVNQIVNKTLQNEGFDYKARVEIDKYLFPKRTYANLTLPGGYYNALQIKLGKGEGSNWWCVLLPPLCLDTKTNKVKNINNQVNNSEVHEIKKINLKFKFAELLDMNALKDFELNILRKTRKIDNLELLKLYALN